MCDESSGRYQKTPAIEEVVVKTVEDNLATRNESCLTYVSCDRSADFMS